MTELETICDGCAHAAYIDGKFRLDGRDKFAGCRKGLEKNVNLDKGECNSREEPQGGETDEQSKS